MNTMEKLARAVCKQQGIMADHIDEEWPAFVCVCRAALEALLEPGDDILFAGAAESRVDEGGYQEAKVVFRAMIQAALDGK